MKKKLIAIAAVLMIAILAFSGCQSGLVTSNVALNKDGSGKKEITILIYADDSILAGEEKVDEPSTVGNNSKYLLVYGTDLENKIKSYAGTPVDVVATLGEDGKTTVVISYEFSSIDDYTAKTKALAKDRADKIEAPTFTENGDGTYTYKENTENTQNSIDNLFYSLYNDPEAFSKDGQGDCDLEAWGYNYDCIYTVISVSATIGENTDTVEVNTYNESNTKVELDWADYIEVTGSFPKGGSSVNWALWGGIAGGVVVIAVIAAIIASKKKKK